MALVVHYSVSDETDNQVGPAFHQRKGQASMESAREQVTARSSQRELRGQRQCKFMQTSVRKSKASLRQAVKKWLV